MSIERGHFYQRRANVEEAMAGASERHAVKEIHEDLARQYRALVRYPGLRPSSTMGPWIRQRCGAAANSALAPKQGSEASNWHPVEADTQQKQQQHGF